MCAPSTCFFSSVFVMLNSVFIVPIDYHIQTIKLLDIHEQTSGLLDHNTKQSYGVPFHQHSKLLNVTDEIHMKYLPLTGYLNAVLSSWSHFHRQEYVPHSILFASAVHC